MARARAELRGLLGDALSANRTGRLSNFVVDERSPAIEIFDPARAATNTAGDWYGEHAGKWLVAAARAAARSGDAEFSARVRHVADYLVSVQRADGYLGTYASAHRFMHPQPPKPGTWDGAPSVRTWDIWTHSYLILGLLEVYRHFPKAGYLAAARSIGDLCWRTLVERGIEICNLGNHHGMSATVLMDPAVELYFATGEQRYLDLALHVLERADANPALGLLSRALAGVDAAEIATGKAYQLAWNLVGVAKLYRATGDARFRAAVENLWASIHDHHLTLGGGPWGGVAHRSREVFNAPGVFSPYGYVETCSILAWIQLNRELLAISADPRYADEIERSAYNDLLGAMAPNGEDWCYYSFPNGQRVHTTYWRCCKSSGAMALEELPDIAYTVSADAGITVNLFGPGRAVVELDNVGKVHLEQRTRYPFDGAIEFRINPETPMSFPLSVRIPAWAVGARMRINEELADCAIRSGSYARIDRVWKIGDVILIDLPMSPVVHRRVMSNIQESLAPDGSPVSQEVFHYEYIAVSRGPLTYASELVDGYRTNETLMLEDGPSDAWLRMVDEQDDDAQHIQLISCVRGPLQLQPYYRTGGRVDGAWRLTWFGIAPRKWLGR
ncbi:MAG: beta-L-arabinofuranosidase domain-containing protein [Pseudoxanthomonas sp.]